MFQRNVLKFQKKETSNLQIIAFRHRTRFFSKCIIVQRLLVKDDDIELKPVYYTGVVHNLDLQEKTT